MNLITTRLIASLVIVGWAGALFGLLGTKEKEAMAAINTHASQEKTDLAKTEPESPFRAAAVRYQVKDVARAVAFYTKRLDFKVEQQQGTAFAKVSKNGLHLWLSGPGSSGSRAMPDGRKQEPGGWNRIVLEVDDLSARVAAIKKEDVHFRNEIEVGPGGKQIQVEDPDGNPIELFQPAAPPTTSRPSR